MAEIIRIAGRRMGMPLFISSQMAQIGVKDMIIGGAEVQFKAIVKMLEKIRPDMVVANLGSVPLTIFGCKVAIPDDAAPMVTEHPIKCREDLKKLPQIPNPSENKRWNDFIKSTRLFAENYTILMASILPGPFTLAGYLTGADALARYTIKDPEFVRELLDYCVEVIIKDGQAQIDAGTDMIFAGDPTASLLSPNAYKQFGAIPMKQVTDQLNVPVILHMCGSTSHIIEEMCFTGAQGLSLDYPVDLPSVVPRIPSNIVIMGNLEPVRIFLNGNAELVRQKTRELLDKMRNVLNYMMMSGCEIPMYTPAENMIAMMEEVRNYPLEIG